MTTTTAEPSFLTTPRGRLTLALLCAVAFLDFVDASIVNVALPLIRRDLGFSLQGLQWIPSGYMLTYGGFMLLGGRAADLLGRRPVLVAGTTLLGLASLSGGLAQSEWMLVGSRLVQGLGAAMMLPAALSLLTTSFAEGRDRNTALGVWGGIGAFASAVGVLLGGVLAEGPGWRAVFLVNPPICLLVILAIFRLIPSGSPAPRRGSGVDLPGAILVTAGMLLLVYVLVEAPDVGWGTTRTLGGLAAALALLLLFVLVESRGANPLVPLSIFRVAGLAAADTTQLIGVGGLVSMFFFLTLYMQNVLAYSQIETGLAYLPLCVGVAVSAGVSSQLLARAGTRPLTVAGALLAAIGLYVLSRVPVDGSYVVDLLPGLLIASVGLGAVFVSVTTAANAGVAPEQAGLAAALLNASQQLGAALALAILSALAASRTQDLLADHGSPTAALTGGFQRALLVGSLFLVAAAVIALRAPNVRATPQAAATEATVAGEAAGGTP